VILVVDASVATKWFVAEVEHDAALRVLGASVLLVAPDLILLEVANALLKKQRAGELHPAQPGAALARLPSLLTRVDPTAPLAAAALELAAELGHPIYDCVYLVCAIRHNCRVVTSDLAFARKVEGSRFAERVLTIEQAWAGSRA